MIKISSAFSFFIGDFFSIFVFGIHDCCSWTISRLSSETSKIRFTFFYYYYYVFSLQEIYGCFTSIFSFSNMKFFYLVAVFSVNALRQKPFYATKKKKRFPELIELFRNLFFLLFLGATDLVFLHFLNLKLSSLQIMLTVLWRPPSHGLRLLPREEHEALGRRNYYYYIH